MLEMARAGGGAQYHSYPLLPKQHLQITVAEPPLDNGGPLDPFNPTAAGRRRRIPHLPALTNGWSLAG